MKTDLDIPEMKIDFIIIMVFTAMVETIEVIKTIIILIEIMIKIGLTKLTRETQTSPAGGIAA